MDVRGALAYAVCSLVFVLIREGGGSLRACGCRFCVHLFCWLCLVLGGGPHESGEVVLSCYGFFD